LRWELCFARLLRLGWGLGLARLLWLRWA